MKNTIIKYRSSKKYIIRVQGLLSTIEHKDLLEKLFGILRKLGRQKIDRF